MATRHVSASQPMNHLQKQWLLITSFALYFFRPNVEKKVIFYLTSPFFFFLENDLTYPSSNIFSLSHLIFFFFFGFVS